MFGSKKLFGTAAAVLLVGSVVAAHPRNEANAKMQKQDFGKVSDGKSADLYTLTNKHGMEVSITNFGATVVSHQRARQDRQVRRRYSRPYKRRRI